MADIFISYSRKDGDFAEILRSRLKEQGFTSWIDLEGLRAGEEWRQEIDQEIRDSLAVVVILTANSRNSEYVAYEWAFAIGAGVRVIPILLEPMVLPPRLATVQHLDFIDRESRPWKSLFEALKAAEAEGSARSVRVSRTAPIVVREAVKALDSADSAEMEKAVLRLAEMQIPEAEEALVGALKHPLPDVRIASAWQLAKRGDARAVPGLIEGNRRRGWHSEFARKIREIGHAALPGLRPMLTDPQPWMRRDAIWAIQEVGGSEAAGDLVSLIADSDVEVRVTAIMALGAIGTAADAKALISCLQDPIAKIRLAAIAAIKPHKVPEAVPMLVRLMRPLLEPNPDSSGLAGFSPRKTFGSQEEEINDVVLRAIIDTLQDIGTPEAREAVAPVVSMILHQLERFGIGASVWIHQHNLAPILERHGTKECIEAINRWSLRNVSFISAPTTHRTEKGNKS